MAFIAQRSGGGNKYVNKKGGGQFFTSKGKGFPQFGQGAQSQREDNTLDQQQRKSSQQSK